MNPAPGSPNAAASGFRARLLIAMMLVVASLTGLGLYLAQRTVAVDAARNLEREFQSELDALHGVQETRRAALAERCSALVTRPRIHAALEDDALDLLYPSAKDELRDLMDENPAPEQRALHARFYRFLDKAGALIRPPNPSDVGILTAQEEAQLTLKGIPTEQEIGYLLRKAESRDEKLDEVTVLPITSSETGAVIAAFVAGFEPVEVTERRGSAGMKSGIWVNGWLHLPAVSVSAQATVDREITIVLADPANAERSRPVAIDGIPHLLFYKQLNPGSVFPPAYEVCVYPFTAAIARQRQLRWQILAAGVVLLFGGFVASHLLSARLSRPVEELAVSSEENRAKRQRAESALETTTAELQRSARFSADASHQLKSPITILRLGLDRLLSRDDLPPSVCDELSGLVHQTYRLTSVINDLLLLSQMDAGRLSLDFKPVDLTRVVREWIDDFSALPDAANLTIEMKLPPGLAVKGEKRYTTVIVQNLLENARKYNRSDGRIRTSTRIEGDSVLLRVGNTGRTIAPDAREYIFERFHRGGVGDNVPGHGLGLNLARELARIHGGDLQLAHSDNDWTEFEVRFQLADSDPVASAAIS